MKNIVNELDYLRKCLEIEGSLREAATQEFNNGIQNGTMKQAHDKAIQDTLAAAKNLVAVSEANAFFGA